jgi:CheY-like chemotaxis protein
MTADIALAGFYDYRLVALSVALSVLAAYAALDLAERVSAARRGSQLVWLFGGAMGIGIWATTFVGLGAFHLPVRIAYDWPTMLLSLVTSILASSVALLIVSRPIGKLPHIELLRTLADSVFLGFAIESLHVIGMAAMRLPARFIHSPEMVYGFARQSGGTVRLDSELGFGTSVCLYLPLAGEPRQAEPEALRTLPDVKPGGKILVVDDELVLLEIASAHLTQMGYSVHQAADSAGALAAFARFDDIDLMITDVTMPGGMNGAELAQKVRQLSPRTRVIFSSGFPAEALAEGSGTLVDGPVLHKPYQRSELAAIVRRTMEETVPPGENTTPPVPAHGEELSVNRQDRERR